MAISPPTVDERLDATAAPSAMLHICLTGAMRKGN